MDVSRDARVGTVLAGRYRILERLSEGGMGVVYRGERIGLGKPVAVKFLSSILVAEPRSRTRFEREARAMSRLSHPFCVSVIDFGTEDVPFIVMDYVQGKTLADIQRAGRLGVRRALRFADQMLAGIDHAHGQGIIHRDIKPENVMICEAVGLGEHVRLFDFGLAWLLDGARGPDISMSEAIVGTPSCMPPEQAGGGAVDHRSDLYSAGVVLFEMLAGRKPFVAERAADVMRMHREQPPPRLSDIAPDIAFSEALETVVGRALAKEPEARFQSAAEFRAALRSVPESPDDLGPLDRETTARATPVALRSGEKTRRLGARGAWRKAIVASAVVGIAAAAGVVGISLGPERGEESAAGGGSGTGGAMARAADDRDGTGDDGLEDVRRLAASGRREEAISVLQKLRIVRPRDGRLPLLLGHLFAEKEWWGDALERYRQAVRLDPSLRGDATLNRNLIRLLGSDGLRRRAEDLVLQNIGEAALPYLREAASGHENIKVRRRAAALERRLAGAGPDGGV